MVVSTYEMASGQIQVNQNAHGLSILVHWISREQRVLLHFNICWEGIGGVERMADTTDSQCKHHSFSPSLLPPPYLLSLKSHCSLKARLVVWPFSGPQEPTRKTSGKDFLSWLNNRRCGQWYSTSYLVQQCNDWNYHSHLVTMKKKTRKYNELWHYNVIMMTSWF